jgi:hypothetical protein
LFSLERLHKFQAIAGTQAHGSQQQLRLAFRDLVARVPDIVTFAADNHIRLRIEIIDDPLAKQRMLFQDYDS